MCLPPLAPQMPPKTQRGKGKGSKPIGGLRTGWLGEHQLYGDIDLLLEDRKKVGCNERQMGAEEIIVEACLRESCLTGQSSYGQQE